MEERTSYVLVGAFVLAAVAVTVGSIIWILGGRSTESSDIYVVEFNRDVSGLSLGSPVRYLGVEVGAVTAMDLITDRPTHVAVQVEVAASTPINDGTYASLAYQGITGVAYISLAADPGEFAPLSVDAVHEHPVIPARDVGLPALLAQSGNITAEVEILLEQLGDLLSEGNRASVGRSLSNIAALSEALAGERETLAALPQPACRRTRRPQRCDGSGQCSARSERAGSARLHRPAEPDDRERRAIEQPTRRLVREQRRRRGCIRRRRVARAPEARRGNPPVLCGDSIRCLRALGRTPRS